MIQRQQRLLKKPWKGRKMENKQDIICNAVKAIESDFTLNMIARLIYNITNEKQNGHNDARAAEIIKTILE